MSLGINALRRQLWVPTTNSPFPRCSLAPSGFQLLASSGSGSGSSSFSSPFSSSSSYASVLPSPQSPQSPQPVRIERNQPTLVHGSNRLLGETISELDQTEAELLATLDGYQESAQDVPKGDHVRLAGLDDGYPLTPLSNAKPHLTYQQTSSPFVAPFRRYPTKNETKASSHRHRKHLYSHLWGETHYFNGDWRKTYANLSNLTPYPTEWHSRALEVYLTPKQLKTIRNPEPGHHISEIGQRTGAVLQLEPHDEAEKGQQRSLVISGEESHLRKCLDELVNMLGEVRARKRSPDSAAYVPPPQSQQFPNEALQRRCGYWKRATGRTVHEFQPPLQWTRASLREYIGWIVSSQPNVDAKAAYAANQEEHNNSAVVKLMSLLEGGPKSAPRESLTTSAFKLALGFMGQKGTVFYKQLWTLFQVMPHLRVPYDAEVFNIMLENCAKSRNMTRFNTTLIMMNRLGFDPDLLTWQMFLRMIKAPTLKRQIVHDIRTRGLLRNPNDKANISMEMVEHDLEHFIRSCKATGDFQLRDFIAQQDAEYGDSRWLGLNTFKRIVDILGRFGLFADCFRSIIYLARASGGGLKPSADAFNHILVHIFRQPTKGNLIFPKLAIKTIRAMEEVRSSFEANNNVAGKGQMYKPNATTFHLLFHLAYRLRLPNFMAVIWRYAVMHGLSTNWMRLKVTRYLVFGRISRTNNAPVLLRSYIRRLFMDDIMTRSLNTSLMEYLQFKRRQEIIELAQLRGEAAIKHLDPSGQQVLDSSEPGEGVRDPSEPDEGEIEALVALDQDVSPATARKSAEFSPETEAFGEEKEYTDSPPIRPPEVTEAPSQMPVEPEPPEAWHGRTGELSFLSLWRSGANPTRRFDYDIWYRHGLAVAREYSHEFRDWTPKWQLSEALMYAFSRDLKLRSYIRKWETMTSAVRRGIHRNGVSHSVWLKNGGSELPPPLRIPIYSHRLAHLPYSHRFRSFGGDSNDVLDLHIGPNGKKARAEEKKTRRGNQKQLKSYVDDKEFARMFSYIKNPEKKELASWESLIMEQGHDVG